ncbi:MAG: FAD-binding oxidoreductase [Bacillota bacterium]
MKTDADAVVIGGGILGLAVTYYLTRAGKSVLLLEKNEIASGASGANEAFVWTSTRKKKVMPMVQKSIQLYTSLGDELGRDIEYRQCGGYIVIESKEQMERMKPWIDQRHHDGLTEMELLDGPGFREREPLVSGTIVAATWNPVDGTINPIYLCLGLADKSRELGARIWEYSTVQEIRTRGRKVCLVVTDQGEIRTPTVVNAAGAWAASIGRLVGLEVPITPNRMQILVSEPVAPLMDRVIMCSCYILGEQSKSSLLHSGGDGSELGFVYAQTKKGNLLLGSTSEFVGYDKSCSCESIRAISRHVCQLVPTLGEKGILVIRSFANFFPFTKDDFPILGRVPGIQGFYMAAGHNGHGIMLGISSGYLMSELIAYGETSISLEDFCIERFAMA